MTKTCLGSDPESEVCLRKAGSYPKLKPRAPGCSFPFFSAAKTAVTLSYSFHPLRAKTIYTIPAAKGREVCDVLHLPQAYSDALEATLEGLRKASPYHSRNFLVELAQEMSVRGLAAGDTILAPDPEDVDNFRAMLKVIEKDLNDVRVRD